jgi:hypothetical protein
MGSTPSRLIEGAAVAWAREFARYRLYHHPNAGPSVSGETSPVVPATRLALRRFDLGAPGIDYFSKNFIGALAIRMAKPEAIAQDNSHEVGPGLTVR